MTPDTSPNTRSGACDPRRVLVTSTLLLTAFTVVFWNFISTQFGFAVANPGDWGHTLLVPLAVGWLIWSCRDQLVRHPIRCSKTGLLVVCAGISLHVLTLIGPGLLQSHNARSIGVAVTIWGIAVTVFGWASLRVLWFPLLYLVVFGQFLSDDLTAPVTERMQDIATIGEFYQAVKEKIIELGDGIFTVGPDRQVLQWFDPEHVFAITSVDSASAAIDVIVVEGEGTAVDEAVAVAGEDAPGGGGLLDRAVGRGAAFAARRAGGADGEPPPPPSDRLTRLGPAIRLPGRSVSAQSAYPLQLS